VETEKVSAPIEDVAIELNVDLKDQKQEEYKLAESLGLTRQMEIIKLESFGFTCIRRNDVERLLDIEQKDGVKTYRFNEFAGKIPFGAMCKIQELRKNRIFDKLFIVAPSDKSSIDPLLIGEKFTENDTKHLESDEYSYPKKYGKRHRNFFRRDSIVMLIMNWKQTL